VLFASPVVRSLAFPLTAVNPYVGALWLWSRALESSRPPSLLSLTTFGGFPDESEGRGQPLPTLHNGLVACVGWRGLYGAWDTLFQRGCVSHTGV
jgi:hypothetical protein